MDEGANEEFELGDREQDAFLAPPYSPLPNPRPKGVFARMRASGISRIFSRISRKDVSLGFLVSALQV